MARKKATLFGVFIRIFFRSMGVMLLALGIGFVSYFITLHYYRAHEMPVDDSVKEVVLDIVSDAKVTDIAQNLICVTDKKGTAIRYMLLEVFNTNTERLDYINLPVEESITLSNELYQRLYAANEEVPQVMKLANLNRYFNDGTVFEYAEVIVGELLDTEISFYTVMPKSQFQKIFRIRDGAFPESTTDIAVYKKNFWNTCSTLVSEQKVEDYIETMYESIASNLSVNNRKKYASDYTKLSREQIHFYPSYIRQGDTITFFDTEKTAGMLSAILKDSEGFVSEWGSNPQVSDAEKSYDKNIYIANGANITGLASSYRDILANAGYTVTGIGNYTEEILTDTRILVREDGIGYDLLSYFQNATLETAQLPEGTDIEIILGTADAG